MKKLAIVLSMLFSSFLFAEEVTRTYETGDSIHHGFLCDIYTDDFYGGKSHFKYPSRLNAIIPWQDGYILKIGFDGFDNFFPVMELFVKPGTKLNLKDCSFAEVTNVSSNEIEIHYIEKEQ